jgi:hypothetical protein
MRLKILTAKFKLKIKGLAVNGPARRLTPRALKMG